VPTSEAKFIKNGDNVLVRFTNNDMSFNARLLAHPSQPGESYILELERKPGVTQLIYLNPSNSNLIGIYSNLIYGEQNE